MESRQLKKAFLLMLFAASIASFAGCSDTGRDSQPSQAKTNALAKPRVFGVVGNLAEEDKESIGHGGIPGIVFSERGDGVAYLVKEAGKYQVRHNDRTSVHYDLVSHLKISADGRHMAHDYLLEGKRYMVLDGKVGPVFDDVWEPVISPDGLHVAYVARNGDKHYVVIDNSISEGYRSINGNPIFSADSKKIVYTVNDLERQATRVYVTDLHFTARVVKESCEQAQVVSSDRIRIAVIMKTGAKRQVVQFSFAQPEVETRGALFDGIDKLAFSGDGQSVVYAAVRDNKRMLVLNDRENALPDGEMRQPPVVRAGNKGVGVILASSVGHRLYEVFGDKAMSHFLYSEAAYLVYSPDGNQYAYCARKGKSIFMVVNGKNGPPFDIVVSPVFSPDSKLLAYRARKDGKRFVVISDLAGNVLKQLPGHDVVYEPVFSPDGQSIAYGVRDGLQIAWKVERI